MQGRTKNVCGDILQVNLSNEEVFFSTLFTIKLLSQIYKCKPEIKLSL